MDLKRSVLQESQIQCIVKRLGRISESSFSEYLSLLLLRSYFPLSDITPPSRSPAKNSADFEVFKRYTWNKGALHFKFMSEGICAVLLFFHRRSVLFKK